MPGLTLASPKTVNEAVKMLADASGLAKVLSGGTDLLVQLKTGRIKPHLIVDMKRIPGMIGIREVGGGFVIGAAPLQARASLAGNLCNASHAADSVPALIAARATCVIVGSKGKREAPVE